MNLFLPIFFILTGMILSVKAQKLTVAGSLNGGLIAFIIYYSFDWYGIGLLTLFFMVGTLATAWKSVEKRLMKVQIEGEAKRTTGQVLANAGLPAVLAVLSIVFGDSDRIFLLMFSACSRLLCPILYPPNWGLFTELVFLIFLH
jgi:uncharacterized membrane protein